MPCAYGVGAHIPVEAIVASKDTKKVVYRSAVSGEFVTQNYAESHPRTTEREHVRVPPPSKKRDR